VIYYVSFYVALPSCMYICTYILFCQSALSKVVKKVALELFSK
jgi:hypothetical protein